MYDKNLKWTDVTNCDMKKVPRLIILMEQIGKSHWEKQWLTDPLLETPIFPEIMCDEKKV